MAPEQSVAVARAVEAWVAEGVWAAEVAAAAAEEEAQVAAGELAGYVVVKMEALMAAAVQVAAVTAEVEKEAEAMVEVEQMVVNASPSLSRVPA